MSKNKKHKNKNLLNRKKTDPDEFIFTGLNGGEKIDIQLFKYNENECIEINDFSNFDELAKLSNNNDYKIWLNINGLNNPEIIDQICSKLQIHDLVIQDILDVNQRPKYQEFENFCFFTIKSIVPTNTEILTEQISFVFAKNYLISFQEKKGDYFDHIRYRLREDKGIVRSRASDYLLFTMLESILDGYFKVLDQLEIDTEAVNELNFNSENSPTILEKIEKYKKRVHLIRKVILPIKDFSLIVERESNPYIEDRHLKYFFEIKDLCLTLLDSCDTIDSELESSSNMYFSLQGHRLNQVMKTLTIVATIFIPLTFIAGIYGMNFKYMPELIWDYGYLYVLILMAIVVIGMLFFLYKRKWF